MIENQGDVFRIFGYKVFLLLMAVLPFSSPLSAYSVLSHEAVVDAVWDTKMKPAILSRFPAATPAQLKEAHGYAYGGAIVQDLGYYPHGSRLFSDLTHYVRSGAFVTALIAESETIDEFAFSLGALSHYVSDNDGHRLATNIAEPKLYPKLRQQFGDVVTYEQAPTIHLKTEFAFDVLEVAKGNFAPEAYHDFIGFNVAVAVLQRAFHDTYGLDIKDLFSDLNRTLSSFRYVVSKAVPEATRIAWAQRKNDIKKLAPGTNRRRFLYIMKRSSYESEWGKAYDRPTALDRFMAFSLRLLPPIGPLQTLKLRLPTPEVEQIFMQSFERAVIQYSVPDSLTIQKGLPDTNLDTGTITIPGDYRLNDEAHARLLDLLAKKNFAVHQQIKQELIAFYADLHLPIHTKRDQKEWRRVLTQLQQLKASPNN